MATHSASSAWRILGMVELRAAVCEVAQSLTRLEARAAAAAGAAGLQWLSRSLCALYPGLVSGYLGCAHLLAGEGSRGETLLPVLGGVY